MSPKFSIDGVDIHKVLKGAVIGMAGVTVTLLTMLVGANYHVEISGTDMTPIATMLVSGLISVIINILRKFVADNSQE